MKRNSFNPSISIIRVIAMLSIVFAHICTWADINTYQLGSIGVEIFFFISGYLYGNKQLPDKKQWMLQRIRRVMLPFWILTAVLSVYLAVSSGVVDAIIQMAEALLNLQGISHILTCPTAIGTLHLPGISHC